MTSEEKNGVQPGENEELTPMETEQTTAEEKTAETETEEKADGGEKSKKADGEEASGDSAADDDEDIDFEGKNGEAAADDTEDGEEKPRKKKHGLLIAGLVALLVAAAGAGYYFWYMPMQAGAQAAEAEKTLVMPDLLYESQEVAEGIAAEMGLPVDIYFVSSESVPAGIVTLQSTTAGEEIPEGEAVALYISLGAAPTPTAEVPLPTPTPKATPKPTKRPASVPDIIAVVPTATPCGG